MMIIIILGARSPMAEVPSAFLDAMAFLVARENGRRGLHGD